MKKNRCGFNGISGITKAAVMAFFNLPECPEKWTEQLEMQNQNSTGNIYSKIK